MQRQELKFSYPAQLIATEPAAVSRIAYFNRETGKPEEIGFEQLIGLFSPQDVLVINDTKVENRRVFAGELEILFVERVSESEWDVLFPARDHAIGEKIALPGGVVATLTAKGLPQRVSLDQPVGEKYFSEFGEPALPPYIQKARGLRHAVPEDVCRYQTDWAENPGSSAAPTASLHFTKADLKKFSHLGVQVCPLTLHVGVGTFLPIKVDDLNQHKMHAEHAHIPATTLEAISQAKAKGAKVWAMGTTVTRALESWGSGKLQTHDQEANGQTDLFIQPGYQFKVVDCLLTNFHQPESSLLALVAAFAGLENVMNTYSWAMEKKFRFFSYGDLTVWRRS